MKAKGLFLFLALGGLLWNPPRGTCLSAKNLEKDRHLPGHRHAAFEPPGLKKTFLEIFDWDMQKDEDGGEAVGGRGGAEEKFSVPVVDEETITKAEKIADQDLLNGLNRILKNNETLGDVLRAENVHGVPLA